MAINNAQLHPAAVLKNQGYRNAAAYSRYLQNFRDRPVYPSFSIHPSGFDNYCPEAVLKFYVNIKRGPGCDPSFFTTIVFEYEIKVTPQLLANLLDLPHSGLQAGNDGEFSSHGFSFDTALETLTRDIGRYYPNRLADGRLFDDMKVLHFFITSSPLAFGPQITKLIYKLGIDLRDKITLCNILEEVRPQHVLAKLDAEVGPQKLVNGSGGVRVDPVDSIKSYHSGKFVGALMNVVVTVVKKETTNSDSESEEEGGVSDYESLPKYPF
ncbi:unnamed protein product [Linum trigynum]|uniref:Uncharacterized protein n=1 Tax=Linum trigynum TaxID=586398 RepID=A0AAV2FE22_9ROSI